MTLLAEEVGCPEFGQFACTPAAVSVDLMTAPESWHRSSGGHAIAPAREIFSLIFVSSMWTYLSLEKRATTSPRSPLKRSGQTQDSPQRKAASEAQAVASTHRDDEKRSARCRPLTKPTRLRRSCQNGFAAHDSSRRSRIAMTVCAVHPQIVQDLGWEFTSSTTERAPLPAAAVLVEDHLRDALVRLNPNIAERPERVDEVLYQPPRAAIMTVRDNKASSRPTKNSLRGCCASGR